MEFPTNDLLQAHAHLCNLLLSFLKSSLLNTTITLGIPDVLHKQGAPMSFSDLTSSLSISPNHTDRFRRLLRALVNLGILAVQEADEITYTLTPTSRLLVTDEPLAVNPFVRQTLHPIMQDPFLVLGDWFRAPQGSAFELFHGKGIWELTEEKAEFNGLINEGMASDARFLVAVVLRTRKDVFEGLRSLVDVGGGTGNVARAIKKAFPDIHCTVFDLPHVIDSLAPSADLDYVSGDMFVSVPKATALLLKWILHDWDDEDCIKILKHCKDAITTVDDKGKVIIIDIVLGATVDKDVNALETQILFDMLLMGHTTGKERNEDEWKKIFLAAGYSNYKITPLIGLRSLIEVYP